MREDGLRIDRLLLTTDTTYIPAGAGPAETERLAEATGLEYRVDRVIEYDYDDLYRLTGANYSTGESYAYEYDPVGNRLKQIIAGDTTEYQYDAANRLMQVDGQAYTFDANGNLLQTGVMTNTWDAANRLVETTRDSYTLEPIYNGLGDRAGQTVGVTTTYFALDMQGLPEVIYTSQGETFLHLPGVIMTESAEGEVRYLLSDGLGSVRQAVDETGTVVAYQAFDPYGNPVDNNGGDPYGYTGEWWEGYSELLYLRARWMMPETGTFLSRDAWSGSPYRPDTLHGYMYAGSNPILYIDPAGFDWLPQFQRYTCDDPSVVGGYDPYGNPCIVNPDNVQTGNGPTHTGVTRMNLCSPAYPGDVSWKYRPECPQPSTTSSASNSFTDLLSNGMDGYIEGYIATVTTAFCTVAVEGKEVVYDFRSGERARFKYTGALGFSPADYGLGDPNERHRVGLTGLSSNFLDVSVLAYAGPIWGFEQKGNLEREYSGVFFGGAIGASVPIPQAGGAVYINSGASFFSSVNPDNTPNFQLWGILVPVGVGGGTGFWDFPVNLGISWTDYTMDGLPHPYGSNNLSMAQDILRGVDSPIADAVTVGGINLREMVFPHALTGR